MRKKASLLVSVSMTRCHSPFFPESNITTKKGKEGKANITWRSTLGWSSRAQKRYDLLGQNDYVQMVYESLRNGYVNGNGMSWTDAEAAARSALERNLGGELYNPYSNYTWNEIIDPATGYVKSDATLSWESRSICCHTVQGFRKKP